MGQEKHTPGPWHTEPEEWTEGRGIMICSKGGIIAVIDPNTCMSTEDHANARLLAAAPELLEACIEARRCINHHGIVGDPVSFMLDAAIQKAEGL